MFRIPFFLSFNIWVLLKSIKCINIIDMRYIKLLTVFSLLFAISANAFLEASFVYCDSVAESRECHESSETEEIEKLEYDEIFLVYSFGKTILNQRKFKFDIKSFENIQDVYLKIIIPPPDLA